VVHCRSRLLNQMSTHILLVATLNDANDMQDYLDTA
jgi:hypothetical protein